MITYASAVSIARPPDVVFPFIVEREKAALWIDVPMRPVTEGPLATGSRMEAIFALGPLKAVIGLEMAAVEPARRLDFRTYSGPIRWDGWYQLTPTAAGTQVAQEGHLVFTGLWRILEPFLGGEISRGEVKELERLKAVVEAS